MDDVKNLALKAHNAGKKYSKKNVNKDSTVVTQYDTIESEGELTQRKKVALARENALLKRIRIEEERTKWLKRSLKQASRENQVGFII